MKNKKLMGLLIGFVCVALCVALLLTFCQNRKDDPEGENPSGTVGQQDPDPTQAEPTTPDVTQPEPTEPEETDPEETEPEATEPEATEPEETQPSGGSTGPSVNTGTGGGYDPGASQPTEPEDVTEPEIVVPEPGSENNAYSEYVQDASGRFTTVKIPAGGSIHYRLKTPGSFLRVKDENAKVVAGETEYLAQNGILEMILPADASQVVSLAFVNEASEDKAYTVEILAALGSQENPIELDSVANIQTALEEGDADGIFYRWTADQDGVLKMSLGSVECADSVADAVITVKGVSVKLSDDNGQAQITVNAGDEVLIQVLTGENAEGIHPEAQIQVNGYVAVIVELIVPQVPAQIESVTVMAKQSVIYRIMGVNNKALKIADSNFRVLCAEQQFSPDEDGMVTVKFPAGTGTVEMELFNDGSEAKAVMMEFNHPLGHKLNPHGLTALGDLELTIPAVQDGYYYTYTASFSGVVTFQVWTAPENEDAKTDIVITNSTSGASAGLWNGDVQNDTVSMVVSEGDTVTICVSVVDSTGKNIDASLAIYGELYGSEEMPIPVMYPGFTASVPAGETLYYEGYNLSGLILSMTASDVTIAHNEVSYPLDGSQVSFSVVAEGRNPARFAITNTGSEMAEYEVVFTYPVGRAENPAALVLGENTLTQEAGAFDYYYSFTAPRAGTLTFTFDSSAQWVYAVDNVTQGIYGDTQWSESDPVQPQSVINVEAGDEIVIRVNTYDAANMFESPAGTVVFDADYVSGPTRVDAPEAGASVTLLPGEGGLVEGQFYGYSLVISNAKNAYVKYDGQIYSADSTGTILVHFPESGSDTLQFVFYNTATKATAYYMQFGSGDMGSASNPETLTMGSHSVTQNAGDEPYYFQYVVETRGTLIFTFETDVEGWYLINNNILRYTYPGQNTYRLTVREGMTVVLAVSTYDPNSKVNPEGTIDFTVELK